MIFRVKCSVVGDLSNLHDGQTILFSGSIVSHTYCVLQLLQDIRWTTFYDVQSVLCVSGCRLPGSFKPLFVDFLGHASVCFLEHNKEWLNTLAPIGINNEG